MKLLLVRHLPLLRSTRGNNADTSSGCLSQIDQIEEVRDLALPELFEGNSVTLIEWGDQIMVSLPKDHLEISFEYADADNDRFITIRANGSEWNSRVNELKIPLR